MKLRRWIQIIFLTAFLGLFPFLSWWYLRGGIEFRKQALDALEVKGVLADLAYRDTAGALLQPRLREFYFGIYFLADEYTPELLAELDKVQVQFTEVNKAYAFVFCTRTQCSELAARYPGWILAPAEPGENQALAAALREFHPAGGGSEPLIILVDREQRVRNTYLLRDEAQMKAFAQQAAVLLPVKQEQELIFERKKEM